MNSVLMVILLVVSSPSMTPTAEEMPSMQECQKKADDLRSWSKARNAVCVTYYRKESK